MKVNIKQLKTILRAVIPENEILIIKGMPGVGKTEVVNQVVEELNRKMFRQHPAVDDLTDYKGFPILTEGKVDFQPIGMMRDLMNFTEPCVWYLDDIGQAPLANQGGIMQWIGRQSRGVNEYSLPEECSIIMTTNDIMHNAGVSGFIDPFKNRPLSILELEPDTSEWIEYAQLQGFDPYVIAYIQRSPQHLNVPDKTKALVGYASSRSWEHVSVIQQLDLSQDLKNLMVVGAVGEKIGNAFNAFRQTATNLPSMAEIVRDPSGAALPDSTSEYYAGAMMLSHMVREDTIAKVLIYVDRFEIDEYKQVFATSMNLKESGAIDTAAYRDWKISNTQLFIETEEDE